MTRSILCCFLILGSFFVHAFHRGNVFRTYTWSKPTSIVNEDFTTRPFKLYSLHNSFKLKMSSVTDDKTDSTASVSDDFSKFAVGQEHEGSLVSAKNFGVFVGIENGVNVLLPRSLLSKGSYDKLKKMADSKSEEKIKLELVGVSAENKTLSGKYLPPGLRARADISVLQGLDTSNKLFNATVVSLHDFGIFAELDDYGIDGLIPASRMPQRMTTEAMSATFPVGTKVSVKIEEVNVANKKLVLSMKNNRGDVTAFTGVSSDKWLQAIVQKVTDFGLFARPAGFDTAGLVHRSQVPRDLIAALKKRVPPSKDANQTDVEYLFSAGDVIKVRVQSVAVDSRRLDLSMLPLRTRVEDEDEYIVEGRDPEGEEYKSYEDSDEEDDKTQYDAESTLLWWKGARYVKEQVVTEAKDEEAEVINESPAIVEGTWRRMFEVDMREDAADFSSKILEAELKELEDEIGELGGLDDEMLDATGFGYRPVQSFGSFIPASLVPSALREQLEFFKDADTAESALSAKLRGGKAVEKEELDNMLKAAEAEVAGQNRRGPAEPAAAVVVEAVTAPAAVADESVAEAVVETITSSEEEPAPSE